VPESLAKLLIERSKPKRIPLTGEYIHADAMSVMIVNSVIKCMESGEIGVQIEKETLERIKNDVAMKRKRRRIFPQYSKDRSRFNTPTIAELEWIKAHPYNGPQPWPDKDKM